MNPNERFGQLETTVSEILVRLDRMDTRLERMDTRLEQVVDELRAMRQHQEKSDERQEVMLRAIQQLLDNSTATMRRVPELDDHEARLRRIEATVFPQRAA